jgi:hypothetical protein
MCYSGCQYENPMGDCKLTSGNCRCMEDAEAEYSEYKSREEEYLVSKERNNCKD